MLVMQQYDLRNKKPGYDFIFAHEPPTVMACDHDIEQPQVGDVLRFSHKRYTVEKIFRVPVKKPIPPQWLATLNACD
jgi:hypothetical protein